MLSLASPLWLTALPLPWLIWRYRTQLTQLFTKYKLNKTTESFIHYPALFSAHTQTKPPSKVTSAWLWPLILCLLIIALSRPQWLDMESAKERAAQDYLLLLDISGSMRALDFSTESEAVSRLDAVKQTARKFIDARPHDRIGIIVFADDAYTLAPSTRDHSLLLTLIDQLEAGLAGEKTALGDAIALGVKRLTSERETSKALFLFTDGITSSGHLKGSQAAMLAKNKKVKVHTIGVGSDQPTVFPRSGGKDIDIVTLALDEQQLRSIAEKTGGLYFRADSSTAIKEIQSTINTLDKAEAADPTLAQHTEWYWLPLMLALSLAFIAEIKQRLNVAPC